MMDPTQLVRQDIHIEYAPVQRGYISKVLPSVTEGVFVILPEGSSEHLYGPCKVAALWGITEPEVGKACVVVFDEQNQPTVVWWDGVYGEEEDPDILPISNTLPAEPVNGQLIYYQQKGTVGESAMEAEGIVWALRYRSGSASTHKWEFAGGAALYNEVAMDQSTTEVTYAALATAGPSVELPLAGDYDVSIGSGIYTATAGDEGKMSYKIGAAAAKDEDGLSFYPGGAVIVTDSSTPNVARVRRKTGLTAAVLLAQYKTTAGTTVHFRERWMSAIPIRVG